MYIVIALHYQPSLEQDRQQEEEENRSIVHVMKRRCYHAPPFVGIRHRVCTYYLIVHTA